MRVLIGLFCFQLLIPGLNAGAQTNEPPIAGQIKELAASVQNDEALDPARRQALLKQLEQAETFLSTAAQFEQKAVKMERDLSQAGSTIEAIQKELAVQQQPPEISAIDAANLAGLEQQLIQVAAKADEARRRLETLETENKALTAQLTTLPEQLAVADARRDQLEQEAAIIPQAEDSPTWETRVHQRAVSTELQSVRAAVNFYKMELKNFDTLKALFTARIDQAARNLKRAEAEAAILRDAVDRQRRIESEAEVARAKQARLEASLHHPAVQAIAERNAELAALRVGENGLSARQRIATADLQAARKTTLDTKRRSEEIQKRIEAAGLTHAVAQLLSRERDSLPQLGNYKSRARAHKKEIADTQLALLDYTDQREELRDIAASVNLRMAEIGDTPEKEQIGPLLTEYLTAQRNQLDTLISEYNQYFNLLVDLDTAEHQLVDSVNVLADDISEHILWVRSDAHFGLNSPFLFAQGFAALAKGSPWLEPALTLQADARSNPFLPLLLLIVELALIAASTAAGKRLKTIDGLVAKIRTDRFAYTMEALFYTVLRALPLPLPLLYLAWRIGAAEAPPFSAAVGTACYLTGILTLSCSLVFQALCPNGLVEAHFDAEKTVLKQFRRLLLRIMPFALPMVWLASLLHSAPQSGELIKPLERLCYVIVQLLVARFGYAVFCKRSKIMAFLRENEPDLQLVRLRVLALYGSVGLPLIIMLEAVIGYYYTALQMSVWFAKTLVLVLVLSLVQSLLIRGIQVVARKAEFERRVRERQELQQQREAAAATDGSELPAEPPPPEEEMNFITLNENTRKLMSIIFGFALLFGMWVIWSDAVPALGVLDRIVVWTVQAEAGAAIIAISLADLIASMIVIMLTVAGARHLPSLLELAVLRQLPIAYGERYAISMVIRYVVVAVGVGVAFNMLGIGWSKFKWLAAALSVGLGFGLQEIFANFISGLILLFERPIRVRDFVTVNGTSGQVTRIQIRATTITDFDNKELLIPNKQFVTGELVNWTLSNSILRIVVPVGVAYGSDTKKVESVLLGIAKSYWMAVADPAPNAFFTGFGDSSLNFELRVFISNAEQFRLATHELNMAVDAAFRKAGIVIAFPQLDLHVQPQPPGAPAID